MGTDDGQNSTSGFWRGNTASITPEETLYRQKLYGTLAAVVAFCLIVVASLAVEAKKGWPSFKRDRRYQSVSTGEDSAPDSQGEKGGPLLEQPGLGNNSIDLPDITKATPEEERAAAEMVLKKEDDMRHANEAFINLRFMLLSVLFFLYVTCSLGLPTLHSAEASCANGFFWEDHIPFLILFIFTKLMELLFYSLDPTIEDQLDWFHFMLKFLPSILGYIDAYTDATAIVITTRCQAEGAATLAKWMTFFYILGVIVAQWLVALYMACQDETHACFMKLIHWDVCASSIALPQKHKTAWIAVNVARTFLEDIPQAVLQSIFLIKIKPNPLMLLSVVVGVLSSMKGVYDAIQRGVAAASELAKALQEQRRQGGSSPAEADTEQPTVTEEQAPLVAEQPTATEEQATAEQPTVTADRPQVRIDFRDRTGGIHTFSFEARPLGIIFTRKAPIMVDDFFKCNSLAKQMGVQKGWVVDRIGNHNVLKDHDFSHVDSLLIANLQALPNLPLSIEFETEHLEARIIKIRSSPMGFEYSKSPPFKVTKISDEQLGIERGWRIRKVAEHEVNSNTSRKELQEWLLDAFSHLPHR